MKSKLHITSISLLDPGYLKFIEHRGGPFHDPGLISLFDELKIAAIRNANDEIMGCFIYTHGKLKAFSAIHTPDIFPNCALIFEAEAQNPSRMNSAKKQVLETISDFLTGEKVSIISLAFPFQFADMQPFIWNKFSVKPKYTYMIDLTKSKDELLSALSSERRNNLSKAGREGYTVKKNQMEDFLKLLSYTFQKINRPAYENASRKILNQYSNSSNAILNVAYKENIPVAGVYCISRNEYANYLFGAFDPESKHEGAGALAMWQSILDCKKRGVHEFDFTGSMVPSIEKYFRGFGGELQTYFSVSKMSSWLKLTAGLFGREIG